MWKFFDRASSTPKSEQPRPQPVRPPAMKAVPKVLPVVERAEVGKGILITGTITAAEPVFMNGKVDGSIEAPKDLVAIGATGEVEGDIRAFDVRVTGKVHGNIVASNRVEIVAGGTVDGNVTALRLKMEAGAICGGVYNIGKPGLAPAAGKGSVAAAEQPKQRKTPAAAPAATAAEVTVVLAM